MRLPAPSLPCSRLAGRRVVFQPYSKAQLETIIRSRLGGWRQCCLPAFTAQPPLLARLWLVSVVWLPSSGLHGQPQFPPPRTRPTAATAL